MRFRPSPAYRAIRDNMPLARRALDAAVAQYMLPKPPPPYDWATDSDLCDVGSEVRAADRLHRAGLGAPSKIATEGRHPMPVPFRAYPGTSSERES